jgi:hypothetical protein
MDGNNNPSYLSVQYDLFQETIADISVIMNSQAARFKSDIGELLGMLKN